MNFPLIRVDGLRKTFAIQKKPLLALRDIHLAVHAGETLGLVGESGCGKSTLGRTIIGLESPSAGTIFFRNKDIHTMKASELKVLRRKVQIIFQDPYASLNPRMSIQEIIGEGLEIHQAVPKRDRYALMAKMVEQMGLDSSILSRYPHQFSGGQRQRISIARALIINPEFVVCDEPFSALDACTQKNILDIFLKLKREKNIAFLFISHDLRAVEAIAEEVAVMYLGTIVERGPTARLFKNPAHPYTQALLAATPSLSPNNSQDLSKGILKGELPSALHVPAGCSFHPRCPFAMPICHTVAPKLCEQSSGHFVSCHLQ